MCGNAFTFIFIYLRLALEVNLAFIHILICQKYSSYKLKTFISRSLVIIHQCMYRHKPKYLSLACMSQDLHMHIDQGTRLLLPQNHPDHNSYHPIVESSHQCLLQLRFWGRSLWVRKDEEQTNFSRNMHLNWNTLLLEALVLAISQLVLCSFCLSRFQQMRSFGFRHRIHNLRGHHRYHHNHQPHFCMALMELACRWFLWLKIRYNLLELSTWVSEIVELICIKIHSHLVWPVLL